MLLGDREVHADETALARYLEGVRPDLPAPFSRYWIDILLSPTPIEPEARRLIRLTGDTDDRRARSPGGEAIALPKRGGWRGAAPTPEGRCGCDRGRAGAADAAAGGLRVTRSPSPRSGEPARARPQFSRSRPARHDLSSTGSSPAGTGHSGPSSERRRSPPSRSPRCARAVGPLERRDPSTHGCERTARTRRKIDSEGPDPDASSPRKRPARPDAAIARRPALDPGCRRPSGPLSLVGTRLPGVEVSTSPSTRSPRVQRHAGPSRGDPPAAAALRGRERAGCSAPARLTSSTARTRSITGGAARRAGAEVRAVKPGR